MAQPAKSGKLFTQAKMEKVRPSYDSQAGILSKKRVDKTRKAFSKDLLRVIDRARKQRLARNISKRASRTGTNGSRQQQGNKDEKKSRPRVVKRVVDTLMKGGHVNIKKADEAVIEELQKQLKESRDEANSLKEEQASLYEQENWETPMLPDELMDTFFHQVESDHVSVEGLLKQVAPFH